MFQRYVVGMSMGESETVSVDYVPEVCGGNVYG